MNIPRDVASKLSAREKRNKVQSSDSWSEREMGRWEKKRKKKKTNRDKGRTASSVRGKGKLEKSSISEFGAKANEQDIKTIETLSLA